MSLPIWSKYSGKSLMEQITVSGKRILNFIHFSWIFENHWRLSVAEENDFIDMSLFEGHQCRVFKLCLSLNVPHVAITHDTLDLTVQPPPSPQLWPEPLFTHGTWVYPWSQPWHPASDIWWPSLETCSNLFHGPDCTGRLPVLTSGGHWGMFGWQVSSKHPTEMLSCFYYFHRPVFFFNTSHIILFFCISKQYFLIKLQRISVSTEKLKYHILHIL